MASCGSPKSISTNEKKQSYHHHIVWLDANLDTSDNRLILKKLRKLDSRVKSFIREDECIEYIREKEDRNKSAYIIFVISGALSEQIIPKIQDCICIRTIFIFCGTVKKYNHLKYPKLRAIWDDTDELINGIGMCIQRDKIELDFSLFQDQQSTDSNAKASKDQFSLRNLKEDQARFLWFYQCHEYMIRLEDEDNAKAKQEMISRWREECPDSQTQSLIDQFDGECLERNAANAIEWYTTNSFIHKCTNTILRKENISLAYSYRYMIKLLCRQLKEEHKRFIQKCQDDDKKTTLRLYRGQYFELAEILCLSHNIHNLISLNGFVSTTRKKRIAMDFIKHHSHEGFEPVLIEIEVNLASKHSIAFADISHLSAFRGESEVLISIGAIFRVLSVDFNEQKQLHVVRLSLDPNDQLTVNRYIEQTYTRYVDTNDRSVLFGKLLCEMGEYQSAIQYFSDALDRLTDMDSQLRAIYLNNIGVCYNEMGRKDDALKFYKKAHRIYTKINHQDGLSACQHNIASIYHGRGDHQVAVDWALKAFDLRQKDKIDKASTLNLLGCIRLAQLDSEAAHNNFNESFKLRMKYLGRDNPHHPDIGVSYQNLGKINSRQSDYIHAEANYRQALEIFRHNYPSSHPLVVEITKCLQETQRHLK